MNPLRTVSLPLLLGLVTWLSLNAQERESTASEPGLLTGDLHLGITFSGGRITHRHGMEAVGFEGELSDGRRYDTDEGNGRGYGFGIAGALDISSRWRLTAAMEFEQKDIRYGMREVGVRYLIPGINDPENPTIIDIWRSSLELLMELNVLQSRLGIDVRALSLWDVDLRVQADLGIGFVLEGTEERRVVKNPDYAVGDDPYLDSILGPLPEAAGRRTIDRLSSAVLSVRGAVALDIPVGRSLSIAPAVTLTRSLTPLIPGSNWHSETVGGSLTFLWSL